MLLFGNSDFGVICGCVKDGFGGEMRVGWLSEGFVVENGDSFCFLDIELFVGEVRLDRISVSKF